MSGNTKRTDTICMVKHYQLHHKKHIEDASDQMAKASNCGWFDLGTLKSFLDKLPTEADGLRVYFGTNFKDGPKQGFNTIILVATRSDGKMNIDMEPPFGLLDSVYDYTIYAQVQGDPDFDNSHLHPPGDGGERVLQRALAEITHPTIDCGS